MHLMKRKGASVRSGLFRSVPVYFGPFRSISVRSGLFLIHVFAITRLDYCCSLYAGLPAHRLGCFDGILLSAARLIGRIPKFGGVASEGVEESEVQWMS